jgi:hypothetical protein
MYAGLLIGANVVDHLLGIPVHVGTRVGLGGIGEVKRHPQRHIEFGGVAAGLAHLLMDRTELPGQHVRRGADGMPTLSETRHTAKGCRTVTANQQRRMGLLNRFGIATNRCEIDKGRGLGLGSVIRVRVPCRCSSTRRWPQMSLHLSPPVPI